MRTANNTNNSLTVENLVDKYCTYVYPSKAKGERFWRWHLIDCPRAERVAGAQLLVTLYSTVAGNEADSNVLSTLSVYAEKYQKDALEEEEFVFLCEHFKDVVSYVFADMDSELGPRVPSNIIKFVQEMVKPKEGQTIFLTHAGCGDIAALFPGCIVRGFTGNSLYSIYKLEIWALGQIRLYALGIKSEIVPIEYKPEGYNDKANAYISTLLEKESADIVIYGSEGAPDLKSEDIQQCRFARARSTHDGHELTFRNIK